MGFEQVRNMLLDICLQKEFMSMILFHSMRVLRLRKLNFDSRLQ